MNDDQKALVWAHQQSEAAQRMRDGGGGPGHARAEQIEGMNGQDLQESMRPFRRRAQQITHRLSKMRPRPLLCERILRIAQRADLERQAAAANAAIQLIAQRGQRSDALVEVFTPAL